MATIDRQKLLNDTKTWLPPDQTLSDSLILAINETVILRIGDDDSPSNYSNVLCQCLKANATKMMYDYTASSVQLKREKVGQVEQEFYNTIGNNPWEAYIDGLETELCPLFGYVAPYDPNANYSVVITTEYNNTLVDDFTEECKCLSPIYIPPCCE